MSIARFVGYAALSLALWYGLQHYLIRSGISEPWPILRYTLVTLPILVVSQALSYMAYYSGYRAFGDRIWLTQLGWWITSFVVAGISGYVALREAPSRGTLVGLLLMLAGVIVARRF